MESTRSTSNDIFTFPTLIFRSTKVIPIIPSLFDLFPTMSVRRPITLNNNKTKDFEEESDNNLIDENNKVDDPGSPILDNCSRIDLKDDYDFVLCSVKTNGSSLKYASDKLKNEEEIVTAAVNENGTALRYASNRLKNDRKIVLSALKQNGSVLYYASSKLKSDQEIVLFAISLIGGVALMHASNQLQSNRDFVFSAVKLDGYALNFADPKFKADPEIVFTAAVDKLNVLRTANLELSCIKTFVLNHLDKYSVPLYVFESTVLYSLSESCSTNNCVLSSKRFNGLEKSQVEEEDILPNEKRENILSFFHNMKDSIGKEASFNFSQHLAEYAGVRLGDQKWWSGVDRLLVEVNRKLDNI